MKCGIPGNAEAVRFAGSSSFKVRVLVYAVKKSEHDARCGCKPFAPR